MRLRNIVTVSLVTINQLIVNKETILYIDILDNSIKEDQNYNKDQSNKENKSSIVISYNYNIYFNI